MLTARNNPRVRLIGQRLDIVPMTASLRAGRRGRCLMCAVTGPVPGFSNTERGRRVVAGITVPGFTTIWQEVATLPEEAIFTLRDRVRSPWQSVWHPRLGELLKGLFGRPESTSDAPWGLYKSK